MDAYSVDLRKRVLADCDAGRKTKEVATKYDVSRSWVRRLKQKRRETGSIAPRPRSGGRPAIIVGTRRERLKQLLAEHPDATLDELHRRLRLKCCRSTVHNTVVALGLSYKKSRSVPANRTDPT
jgi:transposase